MASKGRALDPYFHILNVNAKMDLRDHKGEKAIDNMKKEYCVTK